MNNADVENYYIGIEIDNNGDGTSHIISLELNDCIEKLISKKSGKQTSDKQIDKFSKLFKAFTESMIGYIEFIPLLAELSGVISFEFLRNHMSDFAQQHGKLVEDRESLKVYAVNMETLSECARLAKSIESVMDIHRNIPRMLTSGIVSAYDYHLTELIRWFMTKNPNAFISMSKNVSVIEVLSCDNIDSFKNQLIESEIFSVMVDSHDQQIRWIVEKFKLEDISKKYTKWPELMEIFSRRNLFVHSGGMINEQYITSSKKHKFSTDGLTIGEHLYADRKYFEQSVSTIIEFGIMLYQVVWRKHIPAETDAADQALRNFGYELIVRGKYALAERVFAFALTLREKRQEISERIMIVNYANSIALQNRHEEALSILYTKDWSAVSDNFKVSIASIRKDEKEVASIIRRIGKSGDVRLLDYSEWPVFYHVRDTDDFKKAIKDVFDVDYIAAEKYRGNIEKLIGQKIFGDDIKDNELAEKIEFVSGAESKITIQ